MGLTACAPVDPGPALDEDGEPIPMPGAYDAFLTMEVDIGSNDEGRIPASPVVTLTFSDYLDDDAFVSYGVASLRSGGRFVGGAFDYAMTYKTIVWRPGSTLVDGYDYTLNLNLSGLTSVTRAPFQAPEPSAFWRVDASLPPGKPPEWDRSQVAWPQVEALFSRRCAQCHGDQETWPLLNPLTRASLVGQRASLLPRALVRPLDPTDSYLMHKLLPDYADRQGGAHPPEWGDDPSPLTRQELWLLERWIAQGAAP